MGSEKTRAKVKQRVRKFEYSYSTLLFNSLTDCIDVYLYIYIYIYILNKYAYEIYANLHTRVFLMRTHVSLISCTFSNCNVFENGRTYIYIHIYKIIQIVRAL